MITRLLAFFLITQAFAPANASLPYYREGLKSKLLGIGDAVDPVASSLLDIKSTTKGVLLPRMTNTQRGNISSPAEGLSLYSLTDHRLSFYDGSAYRELASLDGTETLTNKTLTSPTISSPSGITKSDVGLANVDNTSDTTKNAASVSLTNKTIAAGSNTITGLANGNLSGSAAISNANLAAMNTLTIKGNSTGGSAVPSDLSVATVTSMLNAVVGDSGSGGTKGLVPAPSAGDAAANKYLKADGTFAALPSTASPVTSCSATNLKVIRDLTTASIADITADEVVLTDSSNLPIHFTSVSVLPDMNVTGSAVDARDQSAAFSTNDWIYAYIISDGSNVHGLWSLSATAPTMPGGYTYKCRVSAFHALSASSLPNWLQMGRDVKFQPALTEGTATVTIASPSVFTHNSHGLANATPVMLTTSGALPTGFTAGTVYWVVATATNTFELALTPGGAAINGSGSQSGTHTYHALKGVGRVTEVSGGNAGGTNLTLAAYTVTVPPIANGAWELIQEGSGAGIRIMVSSQSFGTFAINPDSFTYDYALISNSSNSNNDMSPHWIPFYKAQTLYYGVNTGTANIYTIGFTLPGLLN